MFCRDGVGGRAADLVERIEASIIGPSQAVRKCLRGIPEQRAGQAVGRWAEVRVIENIEELGAEVQAQLLSDPELALNCKIALECAKAAQHVATEITLRSGRRGLKRRLVEDL